MDNLSRAADIDAWRCARLARLTAPDGWLTLVGLPWLEAGPNTIGSAADNAIVVAGLPAHLGSVVLDDAGAVRAELDANGGGHMDGADPDDGSMRDDSHPHPTVISAGSVSFFVIRRGDKVGLRIKDTHAATREHFLGLDYFPVDASWCIEAEWHAPEPGQTLAMSTVIGTIEQSPVAGTAAFERDGHRFELLPVIEAPGDTRYFVVFADETSGKETYGAARFLYTAPPHDGRIVLDFNQAYNPPCAFTAFAACPMAPPENRLALRVTAGEKTYRGSPH